MPFSFLSPSVQDFYDGSGGDRFRFCTRRSKSPHLQYDPRWILRLCKKTPAGLVSRLRAPCSSAQCAGGLVLVVCLLFVLHSRELWRRQMLASSVSFFIYICLCLSHARTSCTGIGQSGFEWEGRRKRLENWVSHPHHSRLIFSVFSIIPLYFCFLFLFLFVCFIITLPLLFHLRLSFFKNFVFY